MPKHSKRKEVPVDECTRAERAKRKCAERDKRYQSQGAAKVRNAEKRESGTIQLQATSSAPNASNRPVGIAVRITDVLR